MKPQFLNLLNQNLNNSYVQYIQAQNFINPIQNLILQLLNSDDYPERNNLWNQIVGILNQTVEFEDGVNDLKAMSNPYYIGYGNPNADLLFVGLEKAIRLGDVVADEETESKLFFEESVNNIYHFQKLIDFFNLNLNHNISDLNDILLNEFNYSILFPSQLALQFRNHVPVWQNYSKYIASRELNDIELYNELHNEVNYYGKSFCSKCFMTELFHEPSGRHNNNAVLNLERARFLIDNSNFFKSFKTIFFTGKANLPNNIMVNNLSFTGIDYIKNVFDVDDNLDMLEGLIDDMDYNELINLIETGTITFLWKRNADNEIERILVLTNFWGTGHISNDRIQLYSRISSRLITN